MKNCGGTGGPYSLTTRYNNNINIHRESNKSSWNENGNSFRLPTLFAHNDFSLSPPGQTTLSASRVAHHAPPARLLILLLPLRGDSRFVVICLPHPRALNMIREGRRMTEWEVEEPRRRNRKVRPSQWLYRKAPPGCWPMFFERWMNNNRSMTTDRPTDVRSGKWWPVARVGGFTVRNSNKGFHLPPSPANQLSVVSHHVFSALSISVLRLRRRGTPGGKLTPLEMSRAELTRGGECRKRLSFHVAERVWAFNYRSLEYN